MDRIVTATVPYLPHARSRFHFLLSSGSIYSLTTVCTIDHPRLCLACSALSSLSWRVLQPSLKVSLWAASRTVTPANLVETLAQHGRIVRISYWLQFVETHTPCKPHRFPSERCSSKCIFSPRTELGRKHPSRET